MSDAKPTVIEALTAVMASVGVIGKDRVNEQQGRTYIKRGSPFWSRACIGGPEECWEWIAGKSQGYGMFQDRGAHRVAYELTVGPIPDGLTIDHLCRNRGCVNPRHMEIVTRAENARRGAVVRVIRKGGRPDLAARTHCKNGHEFTPNNVVVRKNARICRACAADRVRAFHERRRSA